MREKFELRVRLISGIYNWVGGEDVCINSKIQPFLFL